MTIGRTTIFVAASILTAFAGSARAERAITIGVSHQSLAFPYATGLQKGELAAGKDLGVKIVELDANGDVLVQANHIDQLIAQKVDGILMDPADSQSAMDWADKAKAAGIPIVSMGVWVGEAAKNEPPYVYPSLLALADRNDIEQGYALGKVATADYPKGGKIAIVEGLPGFATVIFRTTGFSRALKESGAKYEVVAQNPANWNPELAHTMCQNAVQSHPDLSFVFVQDQAMAQGCYAALQAASSKAAIYTIDFSQQLKDLISEGAPIKTACSRPNDSGYAAIKTLVEKINTGKDPQNPYLTYHWDVIDAKNIASCPIQF